MYLLLYSGDAGDAEGHQMLNVRIELPVLHMIRVRACVAQPPPTLRGVLERATKPRVEVAFQGWCVWCFGARVGIDVAAWGVWAAACASVSARGGSRLGVVALVTAMFVLET